MKIYDISQELFSCRVYPGSDRPKRRIPRSIESGDKCNVTCLSTSVHNGTHVDAPYHFLEDGKKLDQIPLDHFVGPCYVAYHRGDVMKADAEGILKKAAGVPRILIAGPATVTAEAAEVFAESGICLLGNESQAVGPLLAPMQVHKILMLKEIVLLEGIELGAVPEGRYFLSAAPLNLGGADGAPCRAYLIEGEFV